MSWGAPRLWIAPLLLVVAAACTSAPPGPWGGTAAHDAGASRTAAREVARGDGLAEGGQARAALAVYERVLRDHPGDPAAASALYGLGRLQAGPDVRNYRAAHRAFSRLLAEYPQSRWEAEAHAWRSVLAALIANEDETARLRTQIERLRRTDLDLERRGR